ncbi:hypothetical protein [Actinoplanes derwentensis]|uniref:Uncharacterized protein n=1 Tax=Actinoplanes derwentensis TaxID=113562 RepID=A0A1H2AVZ3_9ACTN|nr:hypothetical protein [Actinoplanes derwentensis]GID87283.1 hypothetical protein Ade03nite_62070 [Actinoplanes derwentensis]SDT50200.1 hypothetical protein SAMN04489716_4144 [Actinoplanes derwentensis]
MTAPADPETTARPAPPDGAPPLRPTGSATPNGATAPTAPPSPAGDGGAAGPADPSLAANRGTVRKAVGDAGNISDRHKLTESAIEALSIGNAFAGEASAARDIVGYQLKAYFGTGTDIRPGELPRHLVEAAEKAYAGRKELLAVIERYTDRRAVIICADPGHGKVAAAIRLLRHRGVQKILLLNSDENLERLEQLEDDAGYILSDPSEATALSAYALSAVTSRLEAHRAHLVVTVSGEALLGEEDLLDLTVRLPPPPARVEALFRHLEWRLPGHGEQLRGAAELASFVATVVRDDTPLREVGELARVISDVQRTRGVIDLDEVRRQIDRRSELAFSIWFDQLDAETRLHSVALAVLNGLPSEFVMDAVRLLRRKMEPSVPGLVTGTGSGAGTPLTLRSTMDHFKTSRSERLHALRATIERSSVRGKHGATRADIMRYHDKTYAAQVLRRAWAEFTAQRVVLDWLGDLVISKTEPVRVWAATALGVLATESFEYVSSVVLERWARSDSPWRRSAAAHALHVPAADPELRPVIRRMVRSWLNMPGDGDDGDFGIDDQDPDPRAQATAALAYGFSLGRSEPDESLAALHRLALVDDIRVGVAVGESLSELILHDSDLLAEPILALILSWLGDSDREATAHLTFLIMATNLLVDVPPETPGGPVTGWPLLLRLAAVHPELRYGLARIWQHLLAESVYLPQQGDEVLFEWARYVDADPAGCRILAEILRMACEDDPLLRNHLLVETANWAESETGRPTPNAAQAAQTEISRGGQGL